MTWIRQRRLWKYGEDFRPGKIAGEPKAHRLERIAAEMRRKYRGLANRERARKAARTRLNRQLQQLLPFELIPLATRDAAHVTRGSGENQLTALLGDR